MTLPRTQERWCGDSDSQVSRLAPILWNWDARRGDLLLSVMSRVAFRATTPAQSERVDPSARAQRGRGLTRRRSSGTAEALNPRRHANCRGGLTPVGDEPIDSWGPNRPEANHRRHCFFSLRPLRAHTIRIREAGEYQMPRNRRNERPTTIDTARQRHGLHRQIRRGCRVPVPVNETRPECVPGGVSNPRPSRRMKTRQISEADLPNRAPPCEPSRDHHPGASGTASRARVSSTIR